MIDKDVEQIVFAPVMVPEAFKTEDEKEQYRANEQYRRARKLFQEALDKGNKMEARTIASALDWSRDAEDDELWSWYKE
jgi:hypothetical protein